MAVLITIVYSHPGHGLTNSVVGQAEYGLGFGPCSLLSGLLGLRVVFYFYTVIEPILQFA